MNDYNRGVCMNTIKRSDGLSIVQLILLIVLLVVLALSAIPVYFNVVLQTQKNQERDDVGYVRDGIAFYARGHNRIFPGTLDGAQSGDASIVNQFFTRVLVKDGVSNGWVKDGPFLYRGPTERLYKYNDQDGTFK